MSTRTITATALALAALSHGALAQGTTAADRYWNSTTPVRAAHVIDAGRLVIAARSDPAGFDRMFERGLVEIRGNVVSTSRAQRGQVLFPAVSLQSPGGRVFAVMASSSGDVARGVDSLKAGQVVAVLCGDAKPDSLGVTARACALR